MPKRTDHIETIIEDIRDDDTIQLHNMAHNIVEEPNDEDFNINEDDNNNEDEDDDDDDDEDEDEFNENMFNENDIDIQEVLTTFFQNDDGANIPEILDNIKYAIDNNSKCILKLAKSMNRIADTYEHSMQGQRK